MLFDDYNESDVLIATVSGTLKEWVIIQNALRQIKSTEIETTLFIAGGHGIRLNGLFHGRQKKNDEIDKKTEYKDNAVRIAVERAIILAKQK